MMNAELVQRPDAVPARASTRSERTRRALRLVRKGLVAVVGFGVLLFGVALIVLPGPAIVVIPLGVAILATEFPWARRLLKWLRDGLHRVKVRVLQMLRRGHPVGSHGQP